MKRTKAKSKEAPLDVDSILQQASSIMNDDFVFDDSAIDADLEAELLALESGGTAMPSKQSAVVRPKVQQKQPQSKGPSSQKSGAKKSDGGLDFGSILAEANSLLNSNVSLDKDDNDDEFLAELNELMGSDGPGPNEENENEYEAVNTLTSAAKSPSASPMHNQQQQQTGDGDEQQQLPEILRNRPKPVYGNLLEVIDDRLRQYKIALEKAQQSQDQGKVRRYTRQLKTLEDQKKSINLGKLVKDEDIPGPILATAALVQHQQQQQQQQQLTPINSSNSTQVTGTSSANCDSSSAATTNTTNTVPSSSSGSEHSPTTDLLLLQSSSSNNNNKQTQMTPSNHPNSASSNTGGTTAADATDNNNHRLHGGDPDSRGVASSLNFVDGSSGAAGLSLLKQRVFEYKVAAQQANKMGDKTTALNYVRIIKGFEEVISSIESGNKVDISNLPGPPPLALSQNSNPPVITASTDDSSLGSASSDNFNNSPSRQVNRSLPPLQPQQQQQQQQHHQQQSTPMSAVAQLPYSQQTAAGANTRQQSQNEGGATAASSGDPNLDALISRMNVYQQASEKAKQNGDSGKARRQDRIKNQYMDAIKAYKANRPVAWDSLTNPVGFPPLPNTAAAASALSVSTAAAPQGGSSNISPEVAQGASGGAGVEYDPIASLLNAAVQQIHATSPEISDNSSSNHPSGPPSSTSDSSSPAAAVTNKPPQSQPPISASSHQQGHPQQSGSSRPPPPVPPNHPTASKQHQQPNQQNMSKAQMTLEFLERRQQQYRSAAISAKKRNDLEEAKRYLRLCKGFDPMISAAKLGKPIDLAQIPPALTGVNKGGAGPVGSSSAAAASASGGGGVSSGLNANNTLIIPIEQVSIQPKHNADPKEVASLFQSIEQQLQLQINKCKYDSDFYASIGEIANVNKAEKMLQCSAVDLNVVQACRLRGELPPKMHYEQRAFTKIRVNNDLNEGECELVISRAINLPCPDGIKPNEMATYAKWAFPWPNESSTTGQTNLVKNSDKPVYNFRQKIPISDRKERMSRQVRRKTFDVTVYTQRGLFKSDKAIGLAQVKLDGLDKKCTLHEVVQLMDPVHTRSKSTCGKIEVSVRIREPFVSKDTEEVVEKWLVVDAEPLLSASQNSSSSRAAPPPPPQQATSSKNTGGGGTGSSGNNNAAASSAAATSSTTAGSKDPLSSNTNKKEKGDTTTIATSASSELLSPSGESLKPRKKSPRPPPRAPPQPPTS